MNRLVLANSVHHLGFSMPIYTVHMGNLVHQENQQLNKVLYLEKKKNNSQVEKVNCHNGRIVVPSNTKCI